MLKRYGNVDCSKPSIFSYFHSIVERADRMARGLGADAKRETWRGFSFGSLRSPPRSQPCVLRACLGRFFFRVREAVNSVKLCLVGRLSRWESSSNGPDSSSGQGHCVVFLGKTLHSHIVSLQPGVWMISLVTNYHCIESKFTYRCQNFWEMILCHVFTHVMMIKL